MPVPWGRMAPILSIPFRLTNTGQVAVVEQGTDQANAEQIGILLATIQGERTMQPGFGIPDPAFSTIPAAVVSAQVALWGPDVSIESVSTVPAGPTEIDVTVNFY